MTARGRHERPDCARQRRRWHLRAVVWQYSGSRTVEWMAAEVARRTGYRYSARTVRNAQWRQDAASCVHQGWLTAMQAAKRLGCSPQWASRLCRVGALHAHRNPGGRWWLVSERAIAAYLVSKGREERAA